MGQPTIDRVTNSEAAERAYRSGDAVFKKGKKVAVRPREGGDLQVVDASEVAARLDSGWALATEDEKGAYVQRKKYGEGIGNELAALPLAGARALSLGTSDALIRTVGGDEAADAVRGIKEENPVASAVGEYGTDIATTVLTGGGAGLLKGLGKTALKQTAKGVGKKALRAGAETGASKALARKAIGAGGAGLRAPVAKTGAELLTLKGSGAGAIKTAAAYTPLGAAARTGATAEYLAARVTKSKAAQLAVSGGIEASLVGAGQGLSRAALDTDHEFTADRALANMASGGAEGLVIGGLTGGVLGGALTGATRLAGRVGRTGKGVADSLRKRAGKSGKAAARSADNAAPSKITLEAASPEARAALDGRPSAQRVVEQIKAKRGLNDTLKDHAIKYADDENIIRKATNQIAKDEGSIAVKRGKVTPRFEKSMPDDPEKVYAASEGLMMGMANRLDDMVAKKADVLADQRGARTAVQRMSDRLKHTLARMDEAKIEAAKAGGKRDHAVLGEIYMEFDDLKRTVGGLADSNNAWKQAEFRPFYRELQAHLEDRSLWGAAVVDEIQEPMNRAWTAHIPTARGYEKMVTRGDLTEATGAGFGFERVNMADTKAIEGALSGLADPTLRENRRMMVEGIRSRKALVEAMETAYGADSKKVQAIRDATERQEATLLAAEQTSLDAKAADELLEGVAAMPWAGATPEAVAGRASAIAGAVGALQAGADNTTSKISGSVQKFLRKAAGKAAGTAARAGAASTARAFTGRDRDEQVAKVYSAVEGYESDPVSATRRTAAAAGVTGVAPAMAAAMATRGAEVAQLLGSKLPRKEITAASLYGGTLDGPPDMSETEKDEILAYAQAATDPMSVVDDFENGVLSFEAVDALKTAWPAIYTQLRDETIEGLAELTEPPPYGERLQLGLLLDIPTDETLEPEFIARIQGGATGKTEQQAAEEQQAALPPSRRSAPDLAGDSETKSQRLSR